MCVTLAVGGTTIAMVPLFASADNSAVAGKETDAATAQTIMLAALSCPTLTGPDLAGQMMANSGFDPNAKTADGRIGVAGLTSATFKLWAPWPNAIATDESASIYALAHDMCDLIGQTRRAGVRGDPWRDGLAAYHSGIGAVQKAHGIPTAAQTYVNTVSGYAAWYALQPAFLSTTTTTAGSTLTPADVGPVTGDPTPVPNQDVAPILTAGSACPQITPAQVAAQLMASSGFNPGQQSPTGAIGIAAFLPDLWNQYAPPTASPWNPATAITTLGRAMCDLIDQLSPIHPTDPYSLALAAFRVGPTPVRQALGVPKIASVQQFITQTQNYAHTYQSDPRLTNRAPTPRSTQQTPTQSPSPTQQQSPVTTTPAPPPGTNTTSPPRTGLIMGFGGLCLDVTNASTTNGTALQLWDCNDTPGQEWTVEPDGTIRALGKCMSVFGTDTAGGTSVDLWTCDGGAHQQWQPYSGGGGKLTNPSSGQCLDPGSAAPPKGSKNGNLAVYRHREPEPELDPSVAEDQCRAATCPPRRSPGWPCIGRTRPARSTSPVASG